MWVFCLHVCIWTTCVMCYEGQKRVPDLLELELQTVVSHPVWVLGTELRSSVRAAIVLNL